MYEEYYGLTEKPFSLTPDPKYIYKSESHAGASDLLQYAIRRREGFVVVTGDIGTGKTTLCRALLEQIDRNTFTALVLNPFLSEDDLLKLILQDFGVVSREEIKSGRLAGVSKQELIDTLYDFLLSLLPLQASAVLIIDEAQNLPLRTLEQIRILSNLETDKEKLLQIILVGQVSLTQLLASEELRQLDQRVSIRYEMQPLTEEEAAAYISHRLSVAGGSAIMFEPQSLRLVHRYSNGIPRLINLICDRTLLAAYSARTNRIAPDLVQYAAESLDIPVPRSPRRFGFFGRRWASAATLLGVVGVPVAVAVGLGPAADLLASDRTQAPPDAQAVTAATRPESAQAAARRPVAAPAATPSIARTREPDQASRRSSEVAADTSVRRLAEVAEPPPAVADLVGEDLAPVAPEPEAPYTVVVSSFPIGDGRRDDSLARLDALTERLTAMGYEVYHVDVNLGSRGWWRRVLVGSYEDLGEAEGALARLQAATHEFNDARAVRSSTIRATVTAS